MHSFDKAGFPHASRPPEQRVIGRHATRKLPGIFQKRIARSIDANQQIKRHTIDRWHGFQPIRLRVPDKSAGLAQIGGSGGRWAEPFQSLGDPYHWVLWATLVAMAHVRASSSSSSGSSRPSARS